MVDWITDKRQGFINCYPIGQDVISGFHCPKVEKGGTGRVKRYENIYGKEIKK